MSPSVATIEELAAAIDAFPATARAPIAWSADARRTARRSLGQHGLCLVGEVHGVAENPLIVADLVAELDIDVVALEWPRGLERALDDLGRLGAGPPAVGRDIHRSSLDELAAGAAWFGDGRVTAGHFAVLRRLGVDVVGVDEPVVSAARGARDDAMAGNVERLLRSGAGRVLFIAGNLHTRLTPHRHYRPAGAHLARDRPGLCSVDIHYPKGHFWNCGPRTFPSAEPPHRPHVILEEATEAVVLTRDNLP